MEVYIVWFNNAYDGQDLVDIYVVRSDAEDFIAQHSDGSLMEIEARDLK